jgi:hypothetical protein
MARSDRRGLDASNHGRFTTGSVISRSLGLDRVVGWRSGSRGIAQAQRQFLGSGSVTGGLKLRNLRIQDACLAGRTVNIRWTGSGRSVAAMRARASEHN